MGRTRDVEHRSDRRGPTDENGHQLSAGCQQSTQIDALRQSINHLCAALHVRFLRRFLLVYVGVRVSLWVSVLPIACDWWQANMSVLLNVVAVKLLIAPYRYISSADLT